MFDGRTDRQTEKEELTDPYKKWTYLIRIGKSLKARKGGGGGAGNKRTLGKGVGGESKCNRCFFD